MRVHKMPLILVRVLHLRELEVDVIVCAGMFSCDLWSSAMLVVVLCLPCGI